MNNVTKMQDVCDATVTRGTGSGEAMGLQGVYHAICHDAQGNLKWEDNAHNMLMTLGKNLNLNNTFNNTAMGASFMGLKGVGSPVVSDTMTSIANWTLAGGNITANRATITAAMAAAALSVSPASAITTASPIVFSITSAGPTTIAGCYVNIGGTNGNTNTTGTLFSAGDFTGGTKSVTAGDTISVTYTLTST